MVRRIIKKPFLFFVMSSGALFFGFMNCSKNKFNLDNATIFKQDCKNNPQLSKDCFNYGQELIKKSFNTTPTDILFVLDDSCSMESIANSVRDGFKSIGAAHFPDNTKMAVTYMSPSNLKPDGEVDYLNAWEGLGVLSTKQKIKILPGHMDLVNSSNIAEFKSLRPSIMLEANYAITIAEFKILFPSVNIDDAANKITRATDGLRLIIKPISKPTASEVASAFDIYKLSNPGCPNSWFAPKDTNSSKQSCLDSAVQLVPACTGVEAGLVSLEQMLQLKTKNNQKVFRDGAFVNIIFVSDTHEAGAAYFGSPGAPKKMANLEKIQSVILANNPNVNSIKFSGVVPLPPAGDEKLKGVKIIGTLPATIEDSKVNGEDLWDFSYLSLIKATKGVAAHASNNNWSAIASSIIDDSKYTGSLVINLKEKAVKIHNLKINNNVIDLSTVVLSTDGKSLTLYYKSTTNDNLNIEVEYQKDVQ